MKSHGRAWLVTLLLCGAGAWWIQTGRAWYRRVVQSPPAAAPSARTETQFVALVLPRVTRQASRFSYSKRELDARLSALRKEGFVSIGLSDVEALYTKRRKLPAKAVLLMFGQDDAQGLEIADKVLAANRMRAVAFVSRAAHSAEIDERRYLTKHAIRQMRKGGAWEFGWISQARPPEEPELGPLTAVLDPDGASTRPANASSFRLRFEGSELGLNDASDDPKALRAMVLRAGRPLPEDLRIVRNAWPRRARFEDRFDGKGIESDWIRGWGVARGANKKLALVPYPRQTGAGVFLRGTEKWKDSIIEFELGKHQKEVWVYARYKGDGSFVRAGVRDDHWLVEQKISAKALPSMLGRAPIIPSDGPQRARFVLKGPRAMLHVNGRMQFGRSLSVHPAVDHGRILVGVYDKGFKTALGVLTYFRAEPVPERWIALKNLGALDEARLSALREGLIYARALSPRWLTVSRDGSVGIEAEQQALVRTLAGFYACRLAPLAELPSLAGISPDGPAAERLLANLAEAARRLEVPAINLRVRPEDAERPDTRRLLERARRTLAASKRELWITLDGPPGAEAVLAGSADGVLRSAAGPKHYELLEAPAEAPPKSSQETASIP